MLKSFPILLLTLLTLLTACSNSLEVRVHNATSAPLTATLRVDRVGPNGTTLEEQTLKPDEHLTLGPVAAPPLEYIELAITRPGDLSDVPTTRRIPRGTTAWTISPDPGSWTGYSITEGIEEPTPSDD